MSLSHVFSLPDMTFQNVLALWSEALAAGKRDALPLSWLILESSSQIKEAPSVHMCACIYLYMHIYIYLHWQQREPLWFVPEVQLVWLSGSRRWVGWSGRYGGSLTIVCVFWFPAVWWPKVWSLRKKRRQLTDADVRCRSHQHSKLSGMTSDWKPIILMKCISAALTWNL